MVVQHLDGSTEKAFWLGLHLLDGGLRKILVPFAVRSIHFHAHNLLRVFPDMKDFNGISHFYIIKVSIYYSKDRWA